jgi:predicted nucleic acid-binding protein
VAELVHGAYRAKTQTQQERRLQFIEQLCRDVPVHSVTIEIAWIAGRIEGEQEAKGTQVAFEDLIIGATALRHGYGVMTLNARLSADSGSEGRLISGPAEFARARGCLTET